MNKYISIVFIKQELSSKTTISRFYYFKWDIINTSFHYLLTNSTCPFSWDCKIHRQNLCSGVRPPPQRVSCL